MIKTRDTIKRNLIIPLISLLTIILSVLYIYHINFLKPQGEFISQNGFMDLSTWDMNGNIFLDGQWDFYPHVLINPEEEDFDSYKDIRRTISVPGDWSDSLNDNHSPNGSGTYRLRIKVSKDQLYGIKTRTIRLANKVYINKGKIIETGKPYIDIKNYLPDSKYKIGFGASVNTEIDLVIQVSSYDYRSGGIIKSIEFGTSESIIKRDRADRIVDGTIISICFVLGLYIFLLSIERKTEKYVLYFSLTTLFMSLYLSTMNEQLLNMFISYNYYNRLLIQVVAMILVTISMLRFIYLLFRKNIKSNVSNILTVILSTNLIFFFLFYKSKNFLGFTNFIQPMVLTSIGVSYLYISSVLARAIYHKIDQSGYINLISTSLFSYWVALIFKVIFELDLGYLPDMMILVMMTASILLMRERQQADYRQVKSLSKRLISYDKLKDEFLAKASLELRKPMETIANISDSLMEGKSGTLNEKQQNNLRAINMESKQLGRIVDDFLYASDFHKNNTDYNLVEVNPYKIIQELLGEMSLLIENHKSIRLVNKVPKKGISILVDIDKFTQIIYNLVHNSIKFSESGDIVVSAYQKDKQVFFEIKDKGRGIKKDQLDHIFEAFYRATDGRDDSEGFGLGLPIVEHLLKLHGGDIEIESLYGEGTLVKFSLPIAEIGHVLSQDNEHYVSREDDKNLLMGLDNLEEHTLLVADNDEANRNRILDVANNMGLRTMVAKTGEEILEIVNKYKVDLIILDLVMAEGPATMVCKEIRKNYSLLELPIVFLTASGRNISLLSSLDCGANDFIKKPSDKEEVESKIRSLIKMKESAKEGLRKEFQYFYSQISPHFLYNTINTIIGLSYNDSELAREALNNLSVYLRGKLDLYKDEDLILLETELELVEAYLEIEKMRYGDRLKVHYDIEENIKLMIPPLTIQPLVENSILHGLSKKEGGGWIKISLKREEDDYISIAIEDNGLGISREKQEEIISGESGRIGFKNIVEKIKLLKGSSLNIESELGKGSKITIKLKEVRASESYTS